MRNRGTDRRTEKQRGSRETGRGTEKQRSSRGTGRETEAKLYFAAFLLVNTSTFNVATQIGSFLSVSNIVKMFAKKL
jgi:hypothetical protein